MKLLFTAGGSHATVFSAAPLAAAARNAGHEILLTVDEPLVPTAASVGLPAVTTPPPSMPTERLDALLELSSAWRPDAVISGLSLLPGLLAAHLRVPYVRQYWDIAPLRPEPLQPGLDRLGLTSVPDAALFIDVCPPCLRPPLTPGARSMRWIPRNRQRPLQRWMYTRSSDRPRVLVTAGTRSTVLNSSGLSIRQLVDQLSASDAEVLVAANDLAVEEYGDQLNGVHIGWIPLDVVAPTCDVVVHHGGAATAMTLMNAGVPQVVVPGSGYELAVGRAMSGFGSALTVEPGHNDHHELADVVADHCCDILASPSYTERARQLAAQIATLTTPDQMVATIEALAS